MTPAPWLANVRARMSRLRAGVPPGARLSLAVLFAGLCVATFGPALLASAGLPLPALQAFAHSSCSPFCHQLPSRSFSLHGHLLPLCARCTGMWLGITLGIAAGLAWPWRRRWQAGLSVMLLGLALSGAEHLHELSGQPGWPWARFTFGLLLFAGLTTAVSFDTLAVLCGAGRAALRRLKS